MAEKILPRTVPTIRVKAPTKDGFALINVAHFNHDLHEVYDKKDAHLVPSRSEEAEAAAIEKLRSELGAAEDRAIEAESERDEWKARAEAAERKLAGGKPDSEKPAKEWA